MSSHQRQSRRSDRVTLRGWGRRTPVEAGVIRPHELEQLAQMALPGREVIARGMGRSYGDAAQRKGGFAVSTRLCRSNSEPSEDGGVRVEAGSTIGELIDRYTPRGWFVPVTPGTREVTVGGAIAADVHGKNHHRDGSFGSHVRSLRLRLADDSIIEASPTADADLFWATIGGMGLTGVILDAELQLTRITSSLVRVRTERLEDMTTLLDALIADEHKYRYSVAWVDLLAGGRSVLTQGDFAAGPDLARELDASGSFGISPHRRISLGPLPLPRLTLRPFMSAFNEIWWRRSPGEPATTFESITSFFHPLDALSDWNRIYGPGGFVQWQCALPDTTDGRSALLDICERFRVLPACLAVLKRFGAANPAPLSFPMKGWTLAVDLPATVNVLRQLRGFDDRVVEAGGRQYLAKDSRMTRTTFEAGYQRLDEWKEIRNQVDPSRRFNSDLAARLGL